MTSTLDEQRSSPAPLDQSVVEQLLKKWCLGDERCGVILQDNTIIELTNGWPDPAHAFGLLYDEMNEVFRRHGRGSVLGIWHTHPNNRCRPSAQDEAGWPVGNFRYFIVTQFEVAEWASPLDRLH
ncbi:metalloprotease [Gordonia phage LilyPad]|nr:metalloprotease [Gordonia phage LilyPad]